jgi:hypothetical protein
MSFVVCGEAADEIDKLRVTNKMLMDDKAALLILRDDYKSDSIKLQRERDAMREALELIAAPMRPDGTWNRERLACQQIAVAALKGSQP